ncbi:tyrosine-protein phosphatase [Paucisalibacillus sp. EB02]|uniref:tyrosine-protein phosphatase n=1 Tax=Paucisalibacillus sp. EB02 TaxID=1347087 RepID=UPI0004AEB7B3|nr:tyrosine-protein phosphatase [Paucisalibacillus sp. EB02]
MEKVLREVHLEGCFNFRELGGYKTSDGRSVKSGILFRSGNLSRLTELDIATIGKLGIKNICDLRDDDEIGKHPDPVLKGAMWNHIPMINDEKAVRQVGDLSHFESKLINSKPGEMLVNLNQDLVANTTAFAKIFRVLLNEPGKPMLFHCMAGKDRTGAVAALLLSTIGVPLDIIEEDYLYTNNTLDAMQEGFNAIGYTMPDYIDKEVVQAMYEARVEYIRAFFNEIERVYGSVESYLLNGIGLEKEDINLLRSHLLD